MDRKKRKQNETYQTRTDKWWHVHVTNKRLQMVWFTHMIRYYLLYNKKILNFPNLINQGPPIENVFDEKTIQLLPDESSFVQVPRYPITFSVIIDPLLIPQLR